MKLRLLLFGFIVFLGSCVDREFDQPPVKEIEIPFKANATIADLKQLYIAGKYVNITSDINIIGVVIADDESGNFYKTLVLQDSTGGIVIKINDQGLYSKFPQNSKIGIICKGLTIGDYGGLIQLGKGTETVNGREQLKFIEATDVPNYLFPGPRNQTVIPKKVQINLLKSEHLSTLIELENVEFKRSDVSKTIANPGGGSFVDLTLTDCSNNTILLHTSDFSSFVNYITPSSNGSIVAVLGKFNSNIQLYLRDTNEIKFINTPCNGNTGSEELVDIKQIRNLYTGSSTTVAKNYKIRGKIISDKDAKNINSQNLFIQDLSGGINLRFSAAHNFNLNQEVEVIVNGIELNEFRGLLQLNNVPLSNATIVSNTITVNPKEITIPSLNSNFESFEGSLIVLKGVSLSKGSGTTYEFNVKVNQGADSIYLFTSSSAVFAKSDFPTGLVDLTVIVSEFDNKQVLLRNLNDITLVQSNAQLKTIRDIRNLFTGTATNILDDYLIKGIVTSERTALNIVTQNIYLQDSTAGITVRFTSNHNFNLGDLVEIRIKGIELSEFNGLLQLNNIPGSLASFISSGNNIIPKNISISDILSMQDNLESQLVKINDVTISKSSGGTFSGSCVLTDATGMIELFTRSQSNFAATPFPTNKVSVIGVVSYFNKPQIVIRTIDDIK